MKLSQAKEIAQKPTCFMRYAVQEAYDVLTGELDKLQRRAAPIPAMQKVQVARLACASVLNADRRI